MSYNLIINKLAIKYNIPTSVIKKLVESQFEFIYEKLKELDFTEVENREEFNSMKTNFNIRYLFNMYPKYEVMKHINNNRKKRKEV
jgi:hypothetical protein